MTRRRLGIRALAGLLAAVLLLAGCGLAADDEPRAIAPDDLPADILDPGTSTSTTASGLTSPVTVYLLTREGDTTRLAPVVREVEDPSRPGQRITALLAGVTEDEQDQGLVSSIPADTVLLGTELIDDRQELIVDLSGALFDIQARELANAFAQIVWTVTELDNVSQVRFRVDGEAYRAPNAEGVEQEGAVTKADYRALDPRR